MFILLPQELIILAINFKVNNLIFNFLLTTKISVKVVAWQRPTLAERKSTTIGAKELNFCVRHGNRCDLLAIVTRQENDYTFKTR